MAPMNVINRASIVVEIQYKDLKMLFTGDSDSALWYEYLEEKYHIDKLRALGVLIGKIAPNALPPSPKLLEHANKSVVRKRLDLLGYIVDRKGRNGCFF